MKKWDKKIVLVGATAVILAVGLIWLAFFWQFGKIRNVADDIQKVQLDSSVKQGRSQKIIELAKELQGIESRENEMKAMLIDKENAVPFLEILEKIAANTNNSIKINVTDLSKIKSQAPKTSAAADSDTQSTKDVQTESQAQKTTPVKNSSPNFSNQLGFSLELDGNYGALVDFFTKLENLPYFVRVYNFQVIPAAKISTSQTVPTIAGAAAAPDSESKNLKSAVTIGVYTNGK